MRFRSNELLLDAKLGNINERVGTRFVSDSEQVCGSLDISRL